MAIVVVFAQVFYQPGQIVQSLPGLYDASNVLNKTLGHYAKYLWAAGLLAAGQSSTMTGTLAGQYVSFLLHCFNSCNISHITHVILR